jgi:hypothetical protein
MAGKAVVPLGHAESGESFPKRAGRLESPDQVVAVLRISGTARHESVKVPASYLGARFVVRGGRIVAGGEFENREQAFEAARQRE